MVSTTETPEPTPLDRAINTASENTLRAVLRSIGAKHEGSRKEAENQLFVKIAKNAEVKGDSETSDEEFVPRYAFCKACEKEFDITTNTEKSCRYHPSPAEPTGEELWEDNYGEFEVDLPEYH
ncbi:hypothetical protein PENDEC_c001G03943 [Penicillium decumbens]|uniref:Uncharacterized protein n=1 Tax=Penicillium decumbens TaxID=69771 RepID=A0A1V6PNQ5_PENDC|nr:hypothetical protein PENDEC_c001G03943 [Penicillium decumbens]